MVTQLQPDVRAYLHGGEVIKRYIRVEEVAHEYGFSVEETEYIAKAAGSLYKLTRIHLVKKERFDEFMKHIYKVPGTNKQIIKKFARIGEASIIYSIGRHIGIGVNGDGETKTALFCVIPDSDKSYNFIIGMLYTQIFQELYYQADFNSGGRLPIHVTFMLDEFANVALPDDFCSLLSTMRSREISSIIIIQNFAQLKALFKDTWETIPGNCDTFIYLGGNEQSTHKYVSELLGKGTIDKKSSGETKGRHE